MVEDAIDGDTGNLQLVIRSLNKQPHKHTMKWLLKIALALDRDD